MKFKVKDPYSALTHFIALIMALVGTVPLLIRASHAPDTIRMVSLIIFMASMIGLYAASTIYHTFDINEKVNKILKKIDHMMIFVLIAGTYTPLCLIAIGDRIGITLLAAVWGIAIVGIVFKAVWVTCPKWVSSVLYIGLGWSCIFAFTKILSVLPPMAFAWLLAGGIFYTVGGILYALKLSIFNSHHSFGSHEIFHLFVMAGSFCHYMLMYQYLSVMPMPAR